MEGVPVESVLVLDQKKIDCIKNNRRNIAHFATRKGGYYLINLKTCKAP